MTCPYCRSQNDLDEHRCGKCGRRTQDRIPVQMTAAVPNLETVEMPAPKLEAPRLKLVSDVPAGRSSTGSAAAQANLFSLVEAPRLQPAAASTFATTAKRRSLPRQARSAQSHLEFQEATTAQSAPAALIYCDVPVAVPAHRVVAATIDTLLALAAVGLFAAVFALAGNKIDTGAGSWPYYAAASALILLFYRVLFCIMNQDTPGLQMTGLQVLDFDGRVPTRRKRWYRLAGGCIGVVAGGIGLLWAVVDEGSLTWHDHMSETYPAAKYS